MNRNVFRPLSLLFLLALSLHAAPRAAAQLVGTSIVTRWNSPSTLTPEQASDVLYREATGQTVSPAQLFEARKYLRTDRSASLGAQVMAGALERLLRFQTSELGGEVRIRVLPPVLQWLQTTTMTDANGNPNVQLRGETVEAGVLNADPNLAATTLFHFTLNETWKYCGSTPCLVPLPGAVRSSVSYELGIPLDNTAPAEARASQLVLAMDYPGNVFAQSYPTLDESRFLGVACDPLPSQTSFGGSSTTSTMLLTHSAARTEHMQVNRIYCGFFAIPGGEDARLTYRVNGGLAAAPAGAAASATVHNPIDFALFE